MAKKVNNTKRRLTFVDIIIILAILGLAGFIIYSVISANKKVSDDKAIPVEYQIRIEKVRYADYSIEILEDEKIKSDFLLKNETVYLTQNSKEIGKVVSVAYEPYIHSTGEVNDSGELIYGEYPGYINIIVTIQVNAEKTDLGYRVSGTVLSTNSDIEFRTSTYFGAGKIVEISVKEEKE